MNIEYSVNVAKYPGSSDELYYAHEGIFKFDGKTFIGCDIADNQELSLRIENKITNEIALELGLYILELEFTPVSANNEK